MRNALLQSVYPQLYSFGNNYEVQVPNLDVSMQMDSEVNMNDNGFCMKSGVFNNDHLQLGNGCFAVPFRSLINYTHQSAYQSGPSSRADIPQQSMFLCDKSSVPHYEADLQAMPNGRKRPIEVDDVLPTRGTDMVANYMTTSNEWKKTKRNKATTSEQQWQHDQVIGTSTHIEEHTVHVPARRSQKLSDKITALQKLVSPYGKTDTSSVLQEASLSIKLLHTQIQNLFKMLSSSYKCVRANQRQFQQEIGEEQVDLRSNGLCLVPVSFTQKVKIESPVDHHA
ncbi:transcription factor bHLH112-like isoform X2 [Corylus avellana]|uniref:transcription factor bHLH112-like isoform X2 n=1 Tax=Corylus avellana TaxID=13451 RepID=UPI00286CA088|nr:transcription factor bHLH112-like isoform X2 [Corylus avellana]